MAVPGIQLFAQEMPQMPGPEKEHEWLKQFVGEWDIVNKSIAGFGQPAMETKGDLNSRMLGDFWVINEMNVEMMGSAMKGIQTIGYNTDKKKYVGTWVDSMMNHMWKYEGSVDETGKKLTLEAEGPDFSVPGKMTLYRDAYEFQSADHIIATSSMQNDDGTWTVFMDGTMTRKKKDN
jgi:hypothetical protein